MRSAQKKCSKISIFIEWINAKKKERGKKIIKRNTKNTKL